MGAKCESHGKVKSYWRPLGFSIFFTNQVRVAMEKYNFLLEITGIKTD